MPLLAGVSGTAGRLIAARLPGRSELPRWVECQWSFLPPGKLARHTGEACNDDEMATFRITATFTLDIHDEAAARQFAEMVIAALVHEEEAKGASVVSEGGSPEVMGAQLADQPKLAATLVVKAALARGVGTLPWAALRDLKIVHVEN